MDLLPGKRNKVGYREASRTSWLAIGEKVPPVQYKEAMKRYSDEQAEIQNKALEKEHQRDDRLKEWTTFYTNTIGSPVQLPFCRLRLPWVL